jgi:hypothetical protein
MRATCLGLTDRLRVRARGCTRQAGIYVPTNIFLHANDVPTSHNKLRSMRTRSLTINFSFNFGAARANLFTFSIVIGLKTFICTNIRRSGSRHLMFRVVSRHVLVSILVASATSIRKNAVQLIKASSLKKSIRIAPGAFS